MFCHFIFLIFYLKRGGIEEGDVTCETPYYGPLCNSCDRLYFKDPIKSICVICPSIVANIIGFISIFIMYLMFYYFMIG